jgi:putative FmdB family regulatory protein
MPIYEYRCPDCRHEFEELVSIVAAEEPRVCPMCASLAERRLSAFAVRVAGGQGAGGERAVGGSKCSGCRRSSCAAC